MREPSENGNTMGFEWIDSAAEIVKEDCGGFCGDPHDEMREKGSFLRKSTITVGDFGGTLAAKRE